MGNDIKKEIQKIIDELKGYNTDPKVCDQRAKSLVITKLEEAQMWFEKVIV
jgi:hypothetical protein